MHENELSEKIIGPAIEVHRILGPGLLEGDGMHRIVKNLKEKIFITLRYSAYSAFAGRQPARQLAGIRTPIGAFSTCRRDPLLRGYFTVAI
jgi:hypothetical protein